MRITFVIPAMQCGGSEKALSILANYLAEAGFNVSLLTFFSGQDKSFFPISERVSVRNLELLWPSKGFLHRIKSVFLRNRVLRKELLCSKPDLVVCFGENASVRVLIAAICTRLPIIVCERTNPELFDVGRMLNILRKLLYPKAARVVVQTQRIADYFTRHHKLECTVIPNVVLQPSQFSNDIFKSRSIIALGRLDGCKQFDLAMKAFDNAANRVSDKRWILEIWGEGADRSRLEKVKDSLSTNSRIFLRGATREPVQKLSAGAFFVLSSKYEGFPNALCEAMACGLPVVSFDCPTGPKEVIRDGIDGRLVPPNNVIALSDAMHELMQNHQFRERAGVRAQEITERFGVDKIMRKWNSLFLEVASSLDLRKS